LEKTEGGTKDAYKTLFISRLSFDVTEEDLKTEFEYYGPVTHVKLIKDKKGKSRGYAFVEFESSRHLKEAFKDADGRKINGRRILVDVERGRTVKDWKPRRFGGGLGATRVGGKDQNQKSSGRDGDNDRDRRRDDRDHGRSDRDRDHDRDHRDRDRDRKPDDRDRKQDDRSRSDRKRSRDRSRSRSRDRKRR